MQKILLAIGYRELEDYLKLQLDNEYEFVGEVVYKEGIVKTVEQKTPDIVIIRETLPGKPNIMSIIYKIRANFPNVRIIFLAGNREVGDELLATLVNYGIYDILYGENIPAQQIISLIKKKNIYNDIKHLQPIPSLDEERNKILFKPPEAEIIEVTKEVIIDKDKEIEDKPEEKKSIFKNITMPIKKENFNIFKNKDNISQECFQNEISQPQSSKEKIITFIGGKDGVGATSLAINTAFSLAMQGNNVIFVEIDKKYPAVSYWYELGLIDEGIDTFVTYLNKNNYEKLNQTIVKSKNIKNKDSSMKDSYKVFPNTLDFLFFSKEYLSGIKEKREIQNIKELYLYLVYQMGYDFVVLDVPSDITDRVTQDALVFSNLIFSVITQDISSIGYHIFNLNELQKKGININPKNNYIINKYVKSDFNEKAIKEWIGVDNVLVVPEYSKEFIEANLKGIPIIIKENNPELVNSIKKITNIIK